MAARGLYHSGEAIPAEVFRALEDHVLEEVRETRAKQGVFMERAAGDKQFGADDRMIVMGIENQGEAVLQSEGAGGAARKIHRVK